nr:DUF1156 domain-containing protein [Candidatus Sigynarchaeum springense]MDO8118299.1 DUF1156 domain-containing protein [Candidatus Sigynarchaeota archaeon]
MTEKEAHPKVLIENWFPFEEVGIECQRERGISSTLPPINRLHVWWARRPLTVSKATILASILPASYPREEFNSFMKFEQNLVEIHRKMILAKKKSEWSEIGYKKGRVFQIVLSAFEKSKIKRENIFGEKIRMLDPMAGGGSIPLEAARLNVDFIASDINPVAAIINFASYAYPLRYGLPLIKKIKAISEKILDQLRKQLGEYYPTQNGQENEQYLWVRTVKCTNPECELNVPLSPNWDIAKNPAVIVNIHPPKEMKNKSCIFKVIENPTKDQVKSNKGSIKGGVGTCPRCNNSLDSDYIKNEAQSGRMGHQLMVIVYKEPIGAKKSIRRFRSPNEQDLAAITKLNGIIDEKIVEWKSKGLIPDEEVKVGEKTKELLNKGIDRWYKLFNSRQLLTNMIILEQINNVKDELFSISKNDKEETKAIITYLQFAFNKILNYNSINTIWMPSRQVIANTFDRHDYGFSWSYGEMDIIRKGFDWGIEITVDRYRELCDMLVDSSSNYQIMNMKSQSLNFIKPESIDLIVVDPPYYDNVMYAELADFFYVWMKKSLGNLYEGFFNSILTDKDNEAVANSSRFESIGKSKKKLAKQDYETKMELCFKEMYRVLQKDGVLTVMFTHKATDAWDTLAMSLMNAGFEITASWPVLTESKTSMNIAKKNAVKTTILLVCRKRLTIINDVWWEDDVLPKIKEVVKQKGIEYQKSGIDGVDLFITVFGPALHEFSRYYPIKDIAGNFVRSEKALNVAREIITDIIYKNVIKSTSISIDLVSKFYLIAWHLYKAREFPFDEARNLALSIGLNVEDLKGVHKILNKKSGDVEIISPTEREKQGFLNLDKPDDNGILVNAVHLALLAYQAGGQKSFETMVAKLRRDTDKSFRQYMDALYNAIPDVKDLEEKTMLAEILVSTPEKIVPKGGKIDDYLADPNLQTRKPRKRTTKVEDEADEEPDQEEGEE